METNREHRCCSGGNANQESNDSTIPHHLLARERIATRVLSATTTVQFMGNMFILDDNGGFVITVWRLTDGGNEFKLRSRRGWLTWGLNNFKLYREDRWQQTAATTAGKPRRTLQVFKCLHCNVYVVVGSIDPFVEERTSTEN